jgi:ribonucleoside-triphosphate reductase
MLEGDANHRPFAYPIPTYNIHERFDWDNPNNDMMWEMTGKYGTPYFGNFINSDMDISDVRSMCCRLRLDLRELRKKTGGLFGSDDSTGSIGVVTIDLPRIAYLSKSKHDFFYMLRYYMDLAKDSLEIKRAFLEEEIFSRHALPAFEEYVGTLDNHFSTIGHIGDNEMCLNACWIRQDLTQPEAVNFTIEVLEFMKGVLLEYQQETGHLYNLEATPAESTCYKLALKDAQSLPGIITQGSGDSVYYTNSCRLPVNLVENIDQAMQIESILQPIHTGGTAEHFYVGGSISGSKAKEIIRHVLTHSRIPYVTISTLTAYCPVHGEQLLYGIRGPINPEDIKCPHCGKPLDLYQRITGYIRKVQFFNKGKAQEFKDRYQLSV